MGKVRIDKADELALKTPEHIRKKNKEWYYNNLDKVRAHSQRYYRENKDIILAKSRTYSKIYYQGNKDRVRAKNGRHWQELKSRAYAVLGGAVCVRCGFKDPRALQIDHINGGGRKHLASFTSNKKYLKYVTENPAEFQILCANCNWIKITENKELYGQS